MKKIAFIFLFVLMMAGGLAGAAEKPVLQIKEVTSPGGLKAWLVEDHSLPIVAVDFAFKGAGSVLDADDKQGTAQLLSNMLDEGAGDMDSRVFQKALLDSSISLKFQASRDEFSGRLKTLSENRDQAFSLLTLALSKPRFEAEPLSRMQKANQSRILNDLTDPEWVAARILNDTAYAGHPYARNSGGTLSSLKNITASDLRGFHKNYLGRNNLLIAVAGDITALDLAASLDAVFGALPDVTLPAPPADITIQNQGQITLYKKDIPQTIIEMMQPGLMRSDPDYHTAQVMNFILGSSGFGSRLTEEIREKRGLTYGIFSSLSTMQHVNGLSVSTSTENKNAAEMLKLIHAEWTKMAESPVTDKELIDAKSYLTGSLPLSFTSTDDISVFLLSLQLDGLPIDYLEQRNKSVLGTTKEDIHRVAKRLLNPAQMTTVLVGQPEGVTPTRILEKLPNVE